ncbi:ATP synthase F0 subunit B [Mycoplasmopsis felis]|uniref:ATP synthase F0 subunit B n=1 Tax=Mycoplasmopsis felis TaxID=33923 RepID=UPI002FF1299F
MLWFFFYKPIKKMMKERKDFVQDNIDLSIKQKEESLLMLEQANENLKNARLTADEIVTKLKLKQKKYLNFIQTKQKQKLKDY